MSLRVRISRPLASMRRMISPISLRRTPSPLTNTKVSSKTDLLLPAHLLAGALVGAAIRARLPLHVHRPLAVDAGLLELPVAHRADYVIRLHEVAAVRTQVDAVPELPFQDSPLQLALARLVQILRRADDQVDEGSQVREDHRHDTPEYADRPATPRVFVGPVDERDPQDDEQEQHQLAGDPEDRALRKLLMTWNGSVSCPCRSSATGLNL